MNMGEQETLITVALPEATRAASGTGFDLNTLVGSNYELRYILEIYVDGNTTDCIRKELFTTATENVVFPVRLVPQRNYRVVAWADIVPVSATERTAEGDYDYYYETSNGLDAVTIIENDEIKWNAMDEYRDAYTAYEVVNNFTANTAINLTLVRPFAKLRVVSTDIKDIEDLGYTLKNGVVEYSVDLKRQFNALYGTANTASYKRHTFTYPTPYDDKDNKNSRTLFADYIFVNNIEEQDAVQFTMSVYENGGLLKTTTFNTDIALRANTLTTIIGEVLTEGGYVNIEINGELNEVNKYTVVSSASHLLKVINAGGEYMLGNDIVVTADDVNEFEKIITRATKTTTINLNGYTITLEDGGNIVVDNGNTLIIDNQPLNENGGDKGAVVNDGGQIVNNGTLVIEGGNYNEGAIQNNGTTNVNGGDFANDAINNNGNVTIEGDNSDNSDDIVNNEGEATLNKVVNNAKELQAAIDAKNADVIFFGADIEGEIMIQQSENVNVVIDGQGKKFDGTFTIDGNWRGDEAEFVKFQNIKFNAKDASKYYNDVTGSMNFIYVPFSIGDRQNLYAHNIIVDLCTFNGGETVVGLHTRQANKITVTNSTFTGMHSLGQIRANRGYAKFDNVTVECLSGINFNDQAVNVEVSNSSITATDTDGYAIRMDAQNAGNVLVNGCTFKADRPVIARRLTSSFDLEFTGVNTLETKQTYQVVLTNVKDDKAYEVPTGTYTLTGADDLIVYPRDVVSSWSEFTTALADDKTFFLLAEDITYDANYQLEKDVIIDLNGKSMTLPMINIHKKVTIKNGTINGKVYARKNSEIVFNNVKFSGEVADNLSTEGHLAIQGGCKSLYAKDCLFSPTSVSGSQTKPLSFEGGSTIMKFENCEFKSSPYKKQVYLNSLSATGSLDFTNCNFNNKTPNIMLAATCPFTNVKMSSTTKLSSVTLETNRAKDAVTAEDLAYLRESLIANNSMSSVRLFYAGGSSEYIR